MAGITALARSVASASRPMQSKSASPTFAFVSTNDSTNTTSATAEVLGFMLEFTDRTHAFVGLQQICQLLIYRQRHCLAEHLRHPPTFTGHRLAYEILQDGVPRRNDALILQVLQGFAQDRDRLRGK